MVVLLYEFCVAACLRDVAVVVERKRVLAQSCEWIVKHQHRE